MTAALRSWAGVARSLVIYRARPWRIARLAAFYRGIVAPGRPRLRHRRPRRQPHPRAPPRRRPRRRARAAARLPRLPRPRPAGASDAPPPRRRPHGRPRPPGGLAPPPHRLLARPRLPRQHGHRTRLPAGALGRRRDRRGHHPRRPDRRPRAPRFIKIDVEGFEPEVLAGLGQPVPWLAFEILAATPDATRACLDRLAALGPYRFNFVPGEARAFAFPAWLDAAALLTALATRPARSGDVYARLADA